MPPEELVDLGETWHAKELDGPLRRQFVAPAFDDSDWPLLPVPSHWQSHAGFEQATGPVLMRRRFSTRSAAGRRTWLAFDGVASSASVWLDGAYRGEIDSYFAPHTFEITDALGRSADHLLAVEVSSRQPMGRVDGRAVGGIWAPVRLVQTGGIRVARCKVLCSEATPERAVLTVRAELDAPTSRTARIRTRITGYRDTKHAGVENELTRSLSAGSNRLRWTVVLERPDLWFPWDLGGQPLYEVAIDVFDDADPHVPSDRATVVTGLRHVAHEKGLFALNGERLFLRGLGPMGFGERPAEVGSDYYDDNMKALCDSGANTVMRDLWVEPPAFYDAADRAGMLVLQGLPSAFTEQGLKPSAKLARQAAELLGHRPSIAAWIRPAGEGPPWRSRFDSMRRVIETADSSRPSMPAPDHWVFNDERDEQVAAFVAKWSRRARLITFSAPPERNERYIDILRRHRYKPVGGFVAATGTPESVSDACQPVRLLVDMPSTVSPGSQTTLKIFIANDLRRAIAGGVVTGRVSWSGHHIERQWGGNATPDSATYIGALTFEPPAEVSEVQVTVILESDSVEARRSESIPVR